MLICDSFGNVLFPFGWKIVGPNEAFFVMRQMFFLGCSDRPSLEVLSIATVRLELSDVVTQ